jgi:hypothetical protein
MNAPALIALFAISVFSAEEPDSRSRFSMAEVLGHARSLSGREIADGGTVYVYEYCWNGSYYVAPCPTKN